MADETSGVVFHRFGPVAEGATAGAKTTEHGSLQAAPGLVAQIGQEEFILESHDGGEDHARTIGKIRVRGHANDADVPGSQTR